MRVSDLDRVQNATAAQNIPLWFGEWSIATNFNATDDFMNQWADAQKLMYSQSAGWIVSLPYLMRWESLMTDPRSSGTSKSRIPRMLGTTQNNGEGMKYWVVILKFILRLPRSYLKAVELGYLTEDPTAYHDPDVCVPYINTTSTTQS